MKKSASAVIAALVAGSGMLGSALDANARCHSCGPLAPVYRYHTTNATSYSTRYHDVSVYQHRTRIRQIYDITRVQPIHHIYDVTRVHHHTVYHTRNAYNYSTQTLAPLTYVHSSVQHYYDCGCR